MAAAVNQDLYQATLAAGATLKMRGKALLAEGTPDAIFEACVYFHEAARAQRTAVDALAPCPPVTRLASLAEVCWCLIEGRDPPRAMQSWGEVLRARAEVDEATTDAILSRVTERFDAMKIAWAKAIAASHAIQSIGARGAMDAIPASERTKAREEVRVLLESYPGSASFWWMSYRLAEADGDKKGAWDSLRRARRLEPHNPRFAAMSLLVASWALTPSAAEKELAGVRPTIAGAEAEVCLMYALAELAVARRESSGAKIRWLRARDAVNAGISRAATDSSYRNLRAVQLLVDDLLAGREPKIDILYVAGLTEAAVAAKPTSNVVDLLTLRARRGELGEAA